MSFAIGYFAGALTASIATYYFAPRRAFERKPVAPVKLPTGLHRTTKDNPVDGVANLLRAFGIKQSNHAACLVVEELAAAMHRRFGGSSITAEWLMAAAALRSEDA